MEIKLFSQYTNEEIEELLFHWFRYYGKKPFSLLELDRFTAMVSDKPKEMFELAAYLYYKKLGSTALLDAMRSKSLDALIKECKTHKRNAAITVAERDFIDEVVNTYNNPEPDVPMDEKAMQEGIKELTRKASKTPKASKNAKVTKLTADKVKKIFIACMLDEENIKDERPTCEFSVVRGMNNLYFLDTAKLNKHKMEIKALLDLLPDLSKPTSFADLCMDRDKNIWTKDSQIMEFLMVLGMAIEQIEYQYPQKEWAKKNSGIPVIVSLDNKISKKISGYEPCEFDEVVAALEDDEEEVENTSNNQKEILASTIEIFKEQYPHIEAVMKMSGYSIELDGNSFYLCRSDGERINKMNLDAKIGSYFLVARDGEYSIAYTYTIDGPAAFGGIIDRNILSINGLKKISDAEFSGRLVQVELGNGMLNANHDPRFELKILEPASQEKEINFNLDEFGFDVSIDNAFGQKDNAQGESKRAIKYTNIDSTPDNRITALLVFEGLKEDDSYFITIDGYAQNKFCHSITKIKDRVGNHSFLSAPLDPNGEAQKVVNDYLRASRIKNLYNHALTRAEDFLPGVKEFIKNNYPLANTVEKIMEEPASNEVEDFLNSNAIKETNLPEENQTTKKELKPKKD